jgi:hypothetical protein
VIVSDSGASGESAEFVRREWPGVRLVRSERGLSFAAACNRGAEAGGGDVMVLLKPSLPLLAPKDIVYRAHTMGSGMSGWRANPWLGHARQTE